MCLAVSTVVALVLAGTKHSGGILPKVYAQDRTAGPVAAHQLGRLRSSTFSPQPTTNGNITVLLVTGETLNVYLNSSPHGDWNNPDSFSSGQLVATLIRRQPEMVINVGTMSSTAGSLHLTSSHEFVFNGQTVDFKSLFLSDLTWLETATATPLSGHIRPFGLCGSAAVGWHSAIVAGRRVSGGPSLEPDCRPRRQAYCSG